MPERPNIEAVLQLATMPPRKRPRRLQIDISADLERKLILWANDRDTPLNTWVRIALKELVDERFARVQESNKIKADRLGLTLEDFETQILKKANYDFDREREELLDESNLDAPDGED